MLASLSVLTFHFSLLTFLGEQLETAMASGGMSRMTRRVRAFILATGMVKTRVQARRQARLWARARIGYASSSHT